MCSDAVSMELPPIRNGTVGNWQLPDNECLASFKLPGPEEKHDVLKDQNPLPRDKRITFDEEKHEYTIDGSIKVPRSVTGLVHHYASHFDPLVAISAMRRGAHWEEKLEAFVTEAGDLMSDDQIVALWAHNGRVCSARGTLLHWHAETLLRAIMHS